MTRRRTAASTLTIGIDVGGTFTDVVCIAADGAQTLAKAASTPADQSEGVVEGLRNLAAALGLDLPALLARTIASSTAPRSPPTPCWRRKGARIGLLTTAGHRDVIEMREGLKPERYDLRLPAPEPLVPRHLRLGVTERLRPDGTRGDAARRHLARRRHRHAAGGGGRGRRHRLPA